MGWVQIEDTFFTNPKIVRAGGNARDLYLAGIFHCNQHLTDGFIDSELLGNIARTAGLRRWNRAKTALEREGLWHPVTGGWMVHDYLDHQRSKAQVLAERQANRDRQAAFRERKRNERHAVTPTTVTPLVTDPEEKRREEKKNEGATPPPLGPPPDKPEPPVIPDVPPERPVRSAPKPRTEQTKLPEDWRPPLPMVEWASRAPPDGLGLPREFVASETERFRDYWLGTGQRKVDWAATWRGWMRKEEQDRRPASRNGREPPKRLGPGEQAAALARMYAERGE